MDCKVDKMSPSKPRFFTKVVPICLVLMIFIGCISSAAKANTRPFDVLNSCDTGYEALLQQKPLMKYAETGELPAHWKPTHSRAWFLAALGKRKLLGSYLKKHNQALQNSDLLTAATYAGQRMTVAMLLKMGENTNHNGSETSALPLQTAAACERGTIMIYLLSSGANVYGVSRKSNINAMAAALIPTHHGAQSYVEGVRLLLAAGFNPRCPITSRGLTAIDIVRNWKQGKTWLESKRLIDATATIASSRNSGKPECGESGRQFRKANK